MIYRTTLNYKTHTWKIFLAAVIKNASFSFMLRYLQLFCSLCYLKSPCMILKDKAWETKRKPILLWQGKARWGFLRKSWVKLITYFYNIKFSDLLVGGRIWSLNVNMEAYIVGNSLTQICLPLQKDKVIGPVL